MIHCPAVIFLSSIFWAGILLTSQPINGMEIPYIVSISTINELFASAITPGTNFLPTIAARNCIAYITIDPAR
ncbi:MAG: hypothetical protein ACLTY0_02560 [Lachnospiraceae bacterium]